ncbi:MAG: hypothetical protein QF437_07755 [Planctomycetota bacterium]|jgi:hypothetical protein|nr:hypothetical protein [Planctomycetota bacterium]MDP7130367.1 hypothetical protein [Planctomycetota bacterium]MDP7249007.1 hypothetical protein [Planctomycetota bacterium]
MESNQETLRDYITQVLHLIERHESYGPGVRQAADAGEDILLDYHTHGPGHGYCVSIQTEKSNPLPILNQEPVTDELAHIRGIGQTEDQCFPLMSMLGHAMLEHYRLAKMPGILLNGQPHKFEMRGTSS